MRTFRTVSIAVLFSTFLALALTGCLINRRQQAKIVLPPPPAPKPSQPAVRPEPLSIPQTQTQLPPPQPISPEALATVQSQVQSQPQTQETQSAPATNGRPARRTGPVAGPKPESAVGPAAAGQSTAAQVLLPAVPPPDAEPRATVQEIVPPAEQKRLQESVVAHRQETLKVLETAENHRLTYEQRGLVARIRSFLQQSEEAEKKNDWRQANTLAERAQVLAKELTGVDQ